MNKMATTTTTSTVGKHHSNTNQQMQLSRVVLRYRDANLKADFSDSDEDDDFHYQANANNNISQASYHKKSQYLYNSSGDDDFSDNEKHNNKITSRLSLAKFRENYHKQNLVRSHTELNSTKAKTKMNRLVNEIMPLITQQELLPTKQIVPHDMYYPQTSELLTSTPRQKVRIGLPKMIQTSADDSKTHKSMGKQKSKIFNMAFGINEKFVRKYLPNETSKRRNISYSTEKLPGHLALYKLMKENPSTGHKIASESLLQSNIINDEKRKTLMAQSSFASYFDFTRKLNSHENNLYKRQLTPPIRNPRNVHTYLQYIKHEKSKKLSK